MAIFNEVKKTVEAMALAAARQVGALHINAQEIDADVSMPGLAFASEQML